MIKRSSSKTTSSIVNAAQSESINAVMGIKANAPVLDLQSASDINNFNVNSNGTLTLRDPLVYIKSPTDAIIHEYIFNNICQLKVTKTNGNLEVVLETPDSVLPVYLRYTTIKGVVVDELFTKDLVLNWKECEFLHTSSTTVIAKALINLTLLPDTYHSQTLIDASRVFRYLNLFFDTDKNIWVIEVINPELNTIITANNAFDANATLDNIYATRDLYNYGKASVTGIIPYMRKDLPTAPDYTLQRTSIVAVSPYQGIFGCKIKKDLTKGPTGTWSILVYTKIPISFVDVNTVYNKHNIQSELEQYLESLETKNELRISFSISLLPTAKSFTYKCGDYIPANTTLVLEEIENIDDMQFQAIEFAFPTKEIYCYPLGSDFETSKDIVPTKVNLGTNEFLYNFNSVEWDGNQDLMVTQLTQLGLTLSFKDSKFHLVKAPFIDTFNYILCLNKTDVAFDISTPLYFTYNMSYGSFNTNTTFYVYAYAANFDDSAEINSLTIQELTESVNNPKYCLVDSFNDQETNPIVLKAFVTTTSNTALDYYCNWEESTDGGLTWHIASQFLDKFKHNIKYIPKDVLTQSNESLENADDYITYVEVVPFNAQSEQDLVSTRPDVLYVLNFNTSKRFRFNIYYANKIDTESQVSLPGFTSIVTLHNLDMEMPKEKSWYIFSKKLKDTSNALDYSFDIKLKNFIGASSDYSLLIQSSLDIRKEMSLNSNATSVSADDNYTFHITASLLKQILQNTTLSHVERLIYKVLYKGVPIKDSEVNILYYYSSTEFYNLGYYDLSWVLTGANLAYIRQANTNPEVLCNILYETATITNGANKETSLDVLESLDKDPQTINIENVKTYYNGSTEDTETPEEDPTQPPPEPEETPDSSEPSEDEQYKQLICRDSHGATLKYSVKFTLYNVSNRPKIIHYFVAHPNTSVYIDNRAEENANDTETILPNIESGQVSVTFKNSTTTSEISTAEDGNINTDISFEKYKYIVIPAHSSIDGEFSVTATTKLTFSYWAISLASKMFLALFLQTTEGFISVTSKGEANAFSWKRHIWANYTNMPCDYLNPDLGVYEYSPTVFSNLGYTNKNLNDSFLELYNFQVLPKILSKNYEAKTTGIRAYVLANQLEYFIVNLVNTKTKLITDLHIDLQRGDFVYYDNRIFTYNVPNHINSIYISNTDSFITPLTNSLEITFGNTITKLIPWRNYLIAFTTNTIHLISYTEEYGYTSKLVSTSVGLPYADRNTPVSVLNSLIFKSGTKLYRMVPNLYSASDSILNITCISDDVGPQLESTNTQNQFAFSTYDEYILCCPGNSSSVVFKYNYTSKIWTRYTYPIEITKSKMLSIDEIYVYNDLKKYYFNKDLKNLIGDTAYDILPYGDYLNNTVDELISYGTDNPLISTQACTPISYSLSFLQKSSKYQVDKQFLESKIIFATESSKPVFPVNIDLYTDEMFKVIHKDANTDSPLWQDAIDQLGILNTNFTSDTSPNTPTLKQLFIKYSGKGKTISHKIYGKSTSKFTFYTINYRYRLLPKKQ